MASRSFFRRQSFMSPCGVLMIVSTALIIFCLVLRNEIQAVFSSSHTTSRPYFRTSDLDPSSSPSPPSQSITTVFGQDPSLADTSTLGDEVWSRKFQTSKGGFLWVRHNETLREGWGISMFHALHCLKMIRTELQHTWSMMEPQPASPHSQGAVHETHKEHRDMDHMKHCLSYIAEVRHNEKPAEHRNLFVSTNTNY